MQMKQAVGQDSETESTEHCPKYKQSTVTQIQLENKQKPCCVCACHTAAIVGGLISNVPYRDTCSLLNT